MRIIGPALALALGTFALLAAPAAPRAQPIIELPEPAAPPAAPAAPLAAPPAAPAAPAAPPAAPPVAPPAPGAAPAAPDVAPAAPVAAPPAPLAVASTPAPEPEVSNTTIGGYAQLDVKYRRVGFGGDFDGTANVRRIVLLVGHRWTDRLSSYVELEWENGLTCAACQGITEVEQAYLDAVLLGPSLKLRAGLILVPLGIVNRWHEPPVFYGVDRPSFDQSIIPSTWRELGIGFVGRFKERLHWEAYLMTALDPTRLGPDGIVGGKTSGALAPAGAGALVARVAFEPRLGSVIGLGGYASDMGGNAHFYDASGQRITLHVPLLGWALDARVRKAGFEARLVAAQFFMPRVGGLLDARRADGSMYYPTMTTMAIGAIPNRIQGGYVELAYEFLHLIPRVQTQQLALFARAETYDTQAAVPSPYAPRGQFDVNELTVGLSYLPIRELVGKADVQLRDRRFGLDEMQIDFGLGWMF